MLGVLMYAQDWGDRLPYGQYDESPTRYWPDKVAQYVGNSADIMVCPSKADLAIGYGWNYNAMPYRTNYVSSRTALGYWKYPSEVMVFSCNRQDGNGSYRWCYSYVNYSASHWAGGETGHVGIVHNNGSMPAYVDGHTEWKSIRQYMDATGKGRRFWGHDN
jgi:prepilin-type processing-associated H-X9-DG protein